VRRVPALRHRLLAAMAASLLVAALALGIAGSWLITDVVRRTNDRVLAGALGTIAETVAVERGKVTLDLPPAAFGMLENAERDNVYYRIAQGDALLTGYADLPAPDLAGWPADNVRFRDAIYRGAPIRIAETLRRLPRVPEPVLVQVAETVEARAALRRRLMLGLLTAEAVLMAAALAALLPALGWGLRPLGRLRRAMESRMGRGAPDLSPLETGPLPVELRPLADAFNGLLAQLDSATAGVRRFTADASHQMRTPLTVLKLQVTLAKRGDAAASEALAEIEQAVNRLERLLTQLLSLARAEEEGRPTTPEPVDLREVATAVLARRATLAIDAGIDIRLEGTEEALPVRGQRTLVAEMLGNLVDNAIRYNRAGGHVAVLLSRDAGTARLVVEDDGPGIPAADHERVFERFVRLDPKPGREGSGLGLAIVRSIATRHGALLTLGERPGGGLRVEVAFPHMG
jgi:two-component system sensor histidine kinase TctE